MAKTVSSVSKSTSRRVGLVGRRNSYTASFSPISDEGELIKDTLKLVNSTHETRSSALTPMVERPSVHDSMPRRIDADGSSDRPVPATKKIARGERLHSFKYVFRVEEEESLDEYSETTACYSPFCLQWTTSPRLV